MKKYVFFAFRGDLMCFQHLLLNVMDMHDKGIEALLVFEGEAVKLIKELEESGNKLYSKVKEAGLIEGYCRACSAKLGVLEYNDSTGLASLGEMSGHPAMSTYTAKGFDVITL